MFARDVSNYFAKSKLKPPSLAEHPDEGGVSEVNPARGLRREHLRDLGYPIHRPRDRLGIGDQVGQLGSVCFHHEDTIQAVTGEILFIGRKVAKQASGLDVRQLGQLAAIH